MQICLGLYPVIPLRVRVEVGIMSAKGYCKLPRAPALESHHRVKLSVLLTTPFWVVFFTLMQGIQLVYSKLYRQRWPTLSISPIDETQTSTNTLSEPGSNGKER